MLPAFAPFYCSNRALLSRSSPSRCNLVHPRALELLHLGLELLHLLPAVQRPPVVGRQAPHHVAPRGLDLVRQRAHLLPALEQLPQVVDLLADGEPAGRGVVLGAGPGRGDLVVGGGQRLGLLALEVAQLLGDAGLDLELD